MSVLNYTGLVEFGKKFLEQLKLDFKNIFVAKETGKDLMTTAEREKLTNISPGAQVNVIETVQVNGTSVTPSGKSINIEVPTKTSDLTNDSGFITSADVPPGAVASTTVPEMDGVATVGTETAFARGDHRHPSDTSKQDVISDLEAIRTGAGLGATAVQPGALSAYATTDAVNTAISTALASVYKFKGTVETYAALSNVSNPANGDVYNVTAAFDLNDINYPAGTNVVWDSESSRWEPLTMSFTIEYMTTSEINDAVTSIFSITA